MSLRIHDRDLGPLVMFATTHRSSPTKLSTKFSSLLTPNPNSMLPFSSLYHLYYLNYRLPNIFHCLHQTTHKQIIKKGKKIIKRNDLAAAGCSPRETRQLTTPRRPQLWRCPELLARFGTCTAPLARSVFFVINKCRWFKKLLDYIAKKQH